jgi:integrase
VRLVPLWPQLRRILTPYVEGRPAGLHFPAPNGRPHADLRDQLAQLFTTAELVKPAGKAWHLFRHTYTAMRLQATDQGAPVSPWTVKTELGHGSLALIETTYGHLLNVRHRLDRVEYRPDSKVLPAIAG